MGLNKDSMDAARDLPRDGEPDVVGFDLQVTAETPAAPTPEELSLRISADYGRRNSDLQASAAAAGRLSRAAR